MSGKMAVDGHQGGVQHSVGAHSGRVARHRFTSGPHTDRCLFARTHGFSKRLEEGTARTPEEQTHHAASYR